MWRPHFVVPREHTGTNPAELAKDSTRSLIFVEGIARSFSHAKGRTMGGTRGEEVEEEDDEEEEDEGEEEEEADCVATSFP